MKNNKLKASLVALMLLAVSTAHSEPIKLDDVKVGSTVTREGISFGWGEHIPVPEGEWKVVMREEGELKGVGAFEHTPRVILNLLNKNKDSALQIVQIFTPFQLKNRQGASTNCPASNGFVTSDLLGTGEGQNYQLCKLIYQPRSYIGHFEFRSDNYTKLKRDEIDFLTERFNHQNPILNVVVLKSGYTGQYPLQYKLGTTKDFDINKIDAWLNVNARLIKEHYDGKRIVFTELK